MPARLPERIKNCVSHRVQIWACHMQVNEWLIWNLWISLVHANIAFERWFSIFVNENHRNLVRCWQIEPSSIQFSISSHHHMNNRNFSTIPSSSCSFILHNCTHHVVSLTQAVVVTEKSIDPVQNGWQALFVCIVCGSYSRCLCAVQNVKLSVLPLLSSYSCKMRCSMVHSSIHLETVRPVT